MDGLSVLAGATAAAEAAKPRVTQRIVVPGRRPPRKRPRRLRRRRRRHLITASNAGRARAPRRRARRPLRVPVARGHGRAPLRRPRGRASRTVGSGAIVCCCRVVAGGCLCVRGAIGGSVPCNFRPRELRICASRLSSNLGKERQLKLGLTAVLSQMTLEVLGTSPWRSLFARAMRGVQMSLACRGRTYNSKDSAFDSL